MELEKYNCMDFPPIAKPLFDKPFGYPDKMDFNDFQKYFESLDIFDYEKTPPRFINLFWDSEFVSEKLKNYFAGKE
jgi:hypothetical protein